MRSCMCVALAALVAVSVSGSAALAQGAKSVALKGAGGADLGSASVSAGPCGVLIRIDS
jgi:hypothetical protein